MQKNAHRSRRSGRLSRRKMLRLSAGGLLAFGLHPAAIPIFGQTKAEDFCFIAVNDFHYIDGECGKWLETAVVPRMKQCSPTPELCLVSGDFTDDGTPEQLTAVREVFKGLDMPVYGVIGNHDWRTQTDRQPYEETFPGRVNYAFEHRGWQFLGLDTTEGLKATKTNIPESTLQWLDQQLPKLDKQRPIILMSHFPLGPGVRNRPVNADALLDRFKELPLRAAFCGHWHGATERELRDAVLTTGKCCSLKKANHDRTKEKGFLFCQIKAGQISRTFVEVPMPTMAAPMSQARE